MAKRYGMYGKRGPAPRFSWDEVRCTDGTLKSNALFRRRVVRQARLLNTLRSVIAAKHGVSRANVYISVNSWYRSPRYNASIHGASNSQHLYGRATDVVIRVTLKTGKTVRLSPSYVGKLAAANVKGLKGIGVYGSRFGLFTHLDSRSGVARWSKG